MADKYVALKGGMDTQTPQVSIDAGGARFLSNVYESVNGGYTTLKGYESIDNGILPSESKWYTVRGERNWGTTDDALQIIRYVELDDSTLFIGAGPKGRNEGMIGEVIHIDYANDVDNTFTMVIMNPNVIPSTPLIVENLNALEPRNHYEFFTIEERGAPSLPHETFTQEQMDELCIATRMGDTRRPKGLGDVTGVHQIGEYTIAWRNTTADNIGGATLSMIDLSSDTKDWIESYPIAIIAVTPVAATGIPSTVFGTDDAVLTNGWRMQDGRKTTVATVDYMILVQTNNFLPLIPPVYGEQLIGIDGLNYGQVTVGNLNWTPLAGGRMSCFDHNFYAGVNTKRAYMADGVNPAMYFDPISRALVPIATSYTGISSDITKAGFCAAFQSRLIMSTLGGGFLTSIVGEPIVVDGTLGSVEIGVGEFVTGFKNVSADELLIFTKDSTWSLSGVDASSWKLRRVSSSSGSKPFCVVDMGDILAADDVGIVDVKRADVLGGFNSSTVSMMIQNLYRAIEKPHPCSTVIQGLEQFRYFFDTLVIIGTKVNYQSQNGNDATRYGYSVGLLPNPVLCVNTAIRADGTEHTIFGSDNGDVYKMDSGTSFQGQPIHSIIELPYNHIGTPQTKKRFEYLQLETVSVGENNLTVEQAVNYGEKRYETRDFVVSGINSHPTGYVGIDKNLTHNNLRLKGTGRNIKMTFTRTSATEPQISLVGYTLRFAARGLVRN